MIAPPGVDRGAQRPRRRRRATPAAKPGKPIPAGLVSPRPARVVVVVARRSSGWLLAAVSGPATRLLVAIVVLGDRLRLRPAVARARPGRGCRSRSGSRCCPSTAGSARPAALPAVVRRPACPCAVARRRGPRDRQRPGRPGARRGGGTSTRSRSASGSSAGLARRTPRSCWRSWRRVPSLVPLGVSRAARSRRGALAAGAVVALGRRGSARRAATSAPRERAVRTAAGGRRGALLRRPAWLAGVRGRGVRRRAGCPRPAAASSRPAVVAPDDGDRVLEPELGDRQVLREVRPVGRADRPADVRAAAGRRPGPRRRRRAAAWR